MAGKFGIRGSFCPEVGAGRGQILTQKAKSPSAKVLFLVFPFDFYSLGVGSVKQIEEIMRKLLSFRRLKVSPKRACRGD